MLQCESDYQKVAPQARADADSLLKRLGEPDAPDCDTLGAWLETDCPDDVKAECGARMTLLAAGGRETWTHYTLRGITPDGYGVWGVSQAGGKVTGVSIFPLRDIGDAWDSWKEWAEYEADRPNFPLSPLVKAWPRRVERYKHRAGQNRMMPSSLAMDKTQRIPPLGRTGRFSPAAHTSPDGQQVLPGFAKPDGPDIAFPIELWQMGGGPEVSQGPGAPMAQRIFVAAIMEVAQQDRHGNHPVDLSIPLREFRKFLYPVSRHPSEWWERLVRARETLNSAMIPIWRPDTQTHALRGVVMIPEIPAGPTELDGPVVIRVDLPPSSEKGPPVSPRLLAWGARDALAFRLLLNLSYRWYRPGRTLRPAKGKRADGKGTKWVYSDDADYYDLISDSDLIHYATPLSARALKRRDLKDAKDALERLVQGGEVRKVGAKILPHNLRA